MAFNGYAIKTYQLRTITDVVCVLEKLNERLRGTELSNFLPFNAVYVVVTQQLAAAIHNRVFDLPEQMERLDLTFVTYYFEELNRFSANQTLSSPWSLLNTPNLPSFMYALIGASIHINYDLPRAILAIVNGKNLQRDFKRADRAIIKARRQILTAYYSTTTGKSFLRFWRFAYTPLVVLLVLRWRHSAWKNFVALGAGEISEEELLKDNLRIAKALVFIGKSLNCLGFSYFFRVKKSLS